MLFPFNVHSLKTQTLVFLFKTQQSQNLETQDLEIQETSLISGFFKTLILIVKIVKYILMCTCSTIINAIL